MFKARFEMHQNTQAIVQTNKRYLHTSPKDDNRKEKSKLEYESSFEDMLKQGEVSEQQQKEFERRREEKAESVRKAQEDLEQQRLKSQQAKEQAFDDLLSGK